MSSSYPMGNCVSPMDAWTYFPSIQALTSRSTCFWIGLKVYLVGGVEKWENRKNLVFPSVCLVGGVKKWEDEKLFYLVEEKVWG